ncbi:MAG: glycosyltransferase family 2 protein [Breznakibacter sp.]
MTTSHKISFIIIGRNEGSNIHRACRSVQEACRSDQICQNETIFVDNNSTDNSVTEAIRVGKVSVYKTLGASGAAIARNIGAQKATGDIFVFLDGDMQLLPGFLKAIFNKRGMLIHPFVSGNWVNWYHNHQGEHLYHEVYRKTAVHKPSHQTVTGGFFVMERWLWEKLGGMDTRLVTGQDLDLGLRSSAIGFKLLRLPVMGVNHHTIHYRDEKRKWKSLLAFRDVYARALLYRKHLWRNPYILKRMVTSDPTWLFLCLAIIVSLITQTVWMLAAYPILAILATSIHRKSEGLKTFASEAAFIITRDLFNLVAFLFFYPRKPHFRVETIHTKETCHA